jgi:RNA polymerase sigma-70 factor (ECF subfamily)
MLGSVHDADDALQETFIRAWRGVDGLREHRAVRPWLFRIASNVCLTELERRRRRGLPHDFGPASSGATQPGEPAEDAAWLEPYPDAVFGLEPGKSSPEALYERRESVELAFLAAVHHLNPQQRAVLLLRDVLGFSAHETADVLGTSVASANSALQRARATVADRIPARSQQTTLRALDKATVATCVERWIAAWESNDVEAFAALLAQDATFAMPPLTTWYRGRDDVAEWARRYSINGLWGWAALLTQANGQPALAFYAWDEDERAYLPFAMNVLSFSDDGLVSGVTAFIVRAPDHGAQADHVRFPDQPLHQPFADMYARFGLPDRLPPDPNHGGRAPSVGHR